MHQNNIVHYKMLIQTYKRNKGDIENVQKDNVCDCKRIDVNMKII